MKNLYTLFLITLISVVSFNGYTQQLSFRVLKPRIEKFIGTDRLVYEVQVKCDASGYYAYALQANFNYNTAALGNLIDVERIGVSSGNYTYSSDPKYLLTANFNSNVINIYLNTTFGNIYPGSQLEWWYNEVPTTWESFVLIRVGITDYTQEAGIVFNQNTMNGAQIYKDSDLNSGTSYLFFNDPNTYDETNNLEKVYLGRIYSESYGWSQSGNPNFFGQWVEWSVESNTSVWNGEAAAITDIDSKAGALRIHSGASLSINPGGQLTLSGDFENNGQFTIVSNDQGDGSFIDNGIITGSGNFNMERYLVSERWHYISPLISDAVSGMFYDIYLTEWDEPTGLFNYIVPEDVDLNVMEGYGVWADDNYTGTTTVTYDGIPNTGIINSGTLTSLGPNDPITGTRGFNFVGNPYPSAVDWDNPTGWIKSELANAIYIWNPNAGNYGSYIDGNIVNDVSNIIPSGQGFYVHVDLDGTTGSLTVNNNARLHDLKPFFKQSESGNDLLKLDISSEINPYTDEMVVRFNDEATAGFDPQQDALELSGVDEAPTLNSTGQDGSLLSINTYPEITDNTMIPVNCKVGEEGIYTIELLNLENFEETINIWLEDLFEGLFIDLKEENSYSFVSSPLDDPARFVLHFIVNSVNIPDLSNNPNIQIFANGETLYLNSSKTNTLQGKLKITSLLGQVVYSKDINQENQLGIRLGEKGIFLVHFIHSTDNRIYSKKVFLR